MAYCLDYCQEDDSEVISVPVVRAASGFIQWAPQKLLCSLMVAERDDAILTGLKAVATLAIPGQNFSSSKELQGAACDMEPAGQRSRGFLRVLSLATVEVAPVAATMKPFRRITARRTG